MSYKIAGIDVHKKVLMVVVIDASTADCEPERRRFATMPSDLRRLLSWLQEKEVKEAVTLLYRSPGDTKLASFAPRTTIKCHHNCHRRSYAFEVEASKLLELLCIRIKVFF